MRLHAFAILSLFVFAAILSACATAGSDGAMQEIPTATMMEKPTEAMMPEPTEAMMDHATLTPEAMGSESTAEAMMDTPTWFSAELTNVNTGENFRINDFKGKVVLVETMAMWCPTCLSQQKQVMALHGLLGMPDDLVTVALDIDPNENRDDLKEYAASHAFDWLYAVSPADVSREIGNLYGDQFLNPPSAPILLIDRQGQVQALPFGIKNAEALQEAIQPLLEAGM